MSCDANKGCNPVEDNQLQQASVLKEEKLNLTPQERDYLQLKEGLETGLISLDIKPNKAMKYLIERTISDKPGISGMLAFQFRYAEWIVLLPGIVALYAFGWLKGLMVIAVCLVVLLIINKIKRKVLQGGVREFVNQDLDSFEALYMAGAVRFRRGKKGKWVGYPQAWRQVIGS